MSDLPNSFQDDPHEHRHHHHDHPHDPEPPGLPDDSLVLERALRELLIEKGVFGADELRAAVEAMEARGEALGARIVARAWTDPAFEALLLNSPMEAISAFGLTMGVNELHVVENTNSVHNIVVCTLCSCYPRTILGIPPAWYKSRAYRARTVREPRAVLAEFGLLLPDTMEVRVHDSTADLRYLVLPRRPEGTDGWSEEALALLVSRDSLIGVAEARRPSAVGGP